MGSQSAAKTADQRKHPRISAPAVARLRRDNGEEFELPVRDVSLGGAFVYVHRMPAELGELVDLSLAVREGQPSVGLRAELVRTVPAPEGHWLLGVGLHFVDVTPEQRQGLEQLLDEILKGGGGQRRAWPRISTRLDVWCSAVKNVRAVLRDISDGGAGLWLDQRMEVGEALNIEIDRPNATALKLSGVVRSFREAPSGTLYHQVGVQFEGLTDERRSELHQFLVKLLHG